MENLNYHYCKSQNDATTAHKMKFSIKDFFSKCDQIRMAVPLAITLLTKSIFHIQDLGSSTKLC